VPADDDRAVGAPGRGVGEEVLGGPKIERRSSPGTSLPWLKMMTAAAPAANALSALTAKSQAPRWMRAMSPAGKPSKSSASQPLDEARSPTRLRSTAVTAAVTSPPPE
jgi:hypothetical protein